MKTKQQMQNLRDALVWWQTVPDANVAPRLGQFTQDANRKTNCGTVACFGGWAARWPSLVQQGMRLTAGGAPKFKDMTCFDAAKPVFGDAQMFHPRGGHEADWHTYGLDLTDHELVTNRIRWALEKA